MEKPEYPTATEMDTFLPQDEVNISNGMAKYKITKGDVEASNGLNGDFDPFKARNLEHPVSNTATLIHLLKSCLGSGILSMPYAFMCAGLVVGIFSTVIVSIICTHCAYILVVCAHELYKRSGKTSMSFADVAEEACRRGPKWAKKYAVTARLVIDIGIFITYFGTCSAYTVLVAKSFKKVIETYTENDVDLRIYLVALLIPLVLLCYVPNLKYLTPVSMIANVFMGVGIGITFYYLVINLNNDSISKANLASPIELFPSFFSITIFAIEGIGVVMPLENHMQKPQNFIGLCGVLNRGMAGVTLMYIFLGFLGYLSFGSSTQGSITLNLPDKEYLAQAVQILIALAVFCTFGLQFFVCLEISWTYTKRNFAKAATFANYVLRTIMVFVAVALAVAIPTIAPFISLIGAFCFSLLGLIFPVLIEMITFWEKGFGTWNWKIWKNVVVIVAGILALVFGTNSAVTDIVAEYNK